MKRFSEVPRLFVLIGDPFLCEEKRKEIIGLLAKEAGPDLSLNLRRAGEFEIQNLLSEARTLPFLVSSQIFCVRGAEHFTQAEIESWKQYFASPHPSSFFIFEAESLDRHHPFLEWAGKAKQVFFLRNTGDRLVADFIRNKLGQAGKKMTPEARGLLEARLGDSLLFLDSVLDQLVLHAGEKTEIDREAVESFEEKLTHFEGGDLTRALAEKNFPKALEILNDLLELSVQDMIPLIGLLHWQLRRFWEARKWLAEGVSEREIAGRLRLFERAPLFFKQVRCFSLKELEKTIEGLFELDWKLKTGRAEGKHEIEKWLVEALG